MTAAMFMHTHMHTDTHAHGRTHSCLYIALVVVLLLVVGGILTAFLFPRDVKVDIIHMNTTNTWVTLQNGSDDSASLQVKVGGARQPGWTIHLMPWCWAAWLDHPPNAMVLGGLAGPST